MPSKSFNFELVTQKFCFLIVTIIFINSTSVNDPDIVPVFLQEFLHLRFRWNIFQSFANPWRESHYSCVYLRWRDSAWNNLRIIQECQGIFKYVTSNPGIGEVEYNRSHCPQQYSVVSTRDVLYCRPWHAARGEAHFRRAGPQLVT